MIESVIHGSGSEVKFFINDYEDIFSDFDPRPFSQKGISEDFLAAAKEATSEKTSKLDFIFVMPKNERNIKQESIIIDRLKKHIQKHLTFFEAKRKKIVSKGYLFTAVGTALMLIATYLFFKFQETSLLASFFTILLEPASWFLFWEGLDLIIFGTEDIESDLFFYRKMIHADIGFSSSP